MVERTQVDLVARGRYAKTPLHEAAENWNLAVVRYLCEQGADKEARDVDDWTPLHGASDKGHLPVVHYFEGLK